MKKAAALSILVAVVLHAVAVIAEAQQPKKVPRIGYLGADPARAGAFRQGLRELGYVEGKNIVIEWRDPEGQADRRLAVVAELVRLKVEVIVTAGARATRAAKETTVTIPIVMTQDPDPIGNGFIASLARPGGNITGLSNLNRELSGKRLELLKEVVPKLSRVAVFGSSTFPGTGENLKETELVAKALAVELQYIEVRAPKDIETAFRSARKERADAVLVLSSGLCSILCERSLSSSRKRLGSRRFIQMAGLWMQVALCPTARTSPTCTGAPLPMWTRF